MDLFYADEDFPKGVVLRLRAVGYDVITAYDDGRANQGIDDPLVLVRAIELNRAVLTRNRRHFARLHRNSPNHTGIVVCTRDPDYDAFAARIDGVVNQYVSLASVLIRIVRPSRP